MRPKLHQPHRVRRACKKARIGGEKSGLVSSQHIILGTRLSSLVSYPDLTASPGIPLGTFNYDITSETKQYVWMGGVCDHSSTGSESAKGQTKEVITNFVKVVCHLTNWVWKDSVLRFIAIRVRPFA